jgi:pimeloyl-ACP methyl ester carboxylesterase
MASTVPTRDTVVSLAAGEVDCRISGPPDSPWPPVVFVHGLLTDGRLWRRVADPLAARGFRCITPTLPLGSHRRPMRPGSDLSPTGVADILADLLARLDLERVTLVGSDTGGAICQFLLDRRPERVARLVLTNCDAFTTFPPSFFVPLVLLTRSQLATAGLRQIIRLRAVRHSLIAFGGLVPAPRDDELLQSWLAPLRHRKIRVDLSRTARGIRPRELAAASARMDRFTGPVRLVWGDADRFFPVELARRLQARFPDATLTTVAGGRTFFFLSHPEPVVEAVAEVSATPVP